MMLPSSLIGRVRRAALPCMLLLVAAAAQGREIVDMAGRHVLVPERISRVYASAPPLTVLLQAVAPEAMIGLSLNLDEEGRHYLPPRIAALPVLGGVYGMGQAMNPEVLLPLKPDIALAWKSPFVDQAMVESSFAKIGLPVVFVSLDTLADWPAAMLFVGQLLGHEDRARRQAEYVNRRLRKVIEAVDAIAEKDRVRVYYAESPTGLATDCNRSFHAEAIELAGGYNVYRCQPQSHMGMEAISLEQVIAFDPQVILAQDPRFAKALLGDERWKNIRAVRDGRVYAIPRWPHNWIDRPPSMMRALGIQWLANLLYPDRLPLDLRKETRAFYQLILGVDLSDADLDRLLR
jgi:iron complex transport system substrate-binding protein